MVTHILMNQEEYQIHKQNHIKTQQLPLTKLKD
jgi:DNA-directed RNA polymerase subunit H (RpoH/RPB5)